MDTKVLQNDGRSMSLPAPSCFKCVYLVHSHSSLECECRLIRDGTRRERNLAETGDVCCLGISAVSDVGGNASALALPVALVATFSLKLICWGQLAVDGP